MGDDDIFTQIGCCIEKAERKASVTDGLRGEIVKGLQEFVKVVVGGGGDVDVEIYRL